jgi:hypothetical protein
VETDEKLLGARVDPTANSLNALNAQSEFLPLPTRTCSGETECNPARPSLLMEAHLPLLPSQTPLLHKAADLV